MKAKFLTLSILLAGSCVLANAQEKKNYYTKKASDNIFVGVGIGGMSVLNGGLNTPTMNFNLQIGKYITPTWGVRGEVSGLWQSLDNSVWWLQPQSCSRFLSVCGSYNEPFF